MEVYILNVSPPGNSLWYDGRCGRFENFESARHFRIESKASDSNSNLEYSQVPNVYVCIKQTYSSRVQPTWQQQLRIEQHCNENMRYKIQYKYYLSEFLHFIATKTLTTLSVYINSMTYEPTATAEKTIVF